MPGALALIIPKDFMLDLERGNGATVGLFVDGQDANSSTVAAGYAQSLSWLEPEISAEKTGALGVRIETCFPKRASGHFVQPHAQIHLVHGPAGRSPGHIVTRF